MASQNAIEASGLEKTYGPTRALDGVTFAVPQGTVFGLLGPNGAGKSTTVKVLTTLTRPDAGQASVAGLDVLSKADAVRRSIGVVGQKSGVDVQATGRENLMLQGHIQRLRGRELRARADELLERFGLAEAADRITKGWSGGMQRRLDIAMGLVHRPQVLFLDEPTAGLDPEVRAQMWAEIRRLSGDEGLTILLTTHYLEEADSLAERLAFVDKGKVVVEGAPEALKAELKGDAVHLELDAAPVNGRVREVLGRIGRVRELHIEGSSVRARVEDGAAALPEVLAALSVAEVPVSTATLARPSLDDVYLRYAGHAFESDERSAA